MKSIRRWLNKCFRNPLSFFSVVLGVTYLQTSLVLRSLLFELGTVYPWLWTLGFVILAFNISLVFTQTLFSIFVEDPVFPEVPSSELSGIPTAILVCVKNEDEEVLERIRYTLRGNLAKGVHFWLLSDSDATFVAKEKEWIERLREEFGGDKIFYRVRPVPFEHKHGNLAEWHEKHAGEYDYLFVADADSTIPRGAVSAA
jgi:membrane glycosyltransferase